MSEPDTIEVDLDEIRESVRAGSDHADEGRQLWRDVFVAYVSTYIGEDGEGSTAFAAQRADEALAAYDERFGGER